MEERETTPTMSNDSLVDAAVAAASSSANSSSSSHLELFHPIDPGDGKDVGGGGSDPPTVIGPYPSYSMGPMEILLIILLFVVWFYAIKRIYTVWSNVLNFSALSADIPGRQPKGTFTTLLLKILWKYCEFCSEP